MTPLPTDGIKRVAVWSAPLRAAHWLMAAATIALLLTGWLMGVAPDLYEVARDYHFIAGYVLIVALALRLWRLCLGSGADGWRALLPRPGYARAALEMLRFYLSFGRASLPRWYAHNPLWAPVYLAWILLLVAQAALGLAIQADLSDTLLLEDLHALGAKAIAIIAGAHVVAVILQDWRGEGSDISAMISGYRIFPIHPPPPFPPPDPRRKSEQ
jgi:Ni/Fe-hydrogenase 1 B-type cytochrome subunit